MAPLDTGYVMNLRLVDPLGDRVGPSPAEFDKIGAYLKAVREHRGLSLASLAETTRISKTYLQAIEDADVSALPSRPFAIGYVRAYAQALGIDGEAAAARFKKETPNFAEPLRNPVGVKHEPSRRNPLIFALIALAVSGVVLWNVAQRSLVVDDPAPPLVTLSGAEAAEPKLPQGPIALGAATAPPADQTTPTPYVTPGLEAAAAPGSPGSKIDAAPAVSAYAAPAVFTPRGAIYGVSSNTPSVVLQANKAASLIVRGAGGTVYFARQLAAGEAYRAPLGAGLTIDAADPDAFQVYVGGQAQGALAAGQVAIDKLPAKAAA